MAPSNPDVETGGNILTESFADRVVLLTLYSVVVLYDSTEKTVGFVLTCELFNVDNDKFL
jgi:hypothetical protein